MSASQSPKTDDRTRTASPNSGLRGTSYVDPHTLMRIKSLQMRAKVVVEGFYTGMHRSPYHGFSVEFSEYRQYTPGDDPRYLDWKLFARSDRYYVKRFEDETNLRCHLLVDMSQSMGFGSAEYTKADYAKTAAATLAYFLSTQRDAVGVLAFDEQVSEYLPPRFRPGHMHRLMLTLERPLAGKGTDLSKPLERIAELVTKRGLVVLISDLLAPIETLQTHLGYLHSRGHEVVVFRVLDPTEIDFAFDKPAMFHDLESGRELYVDPAATRDEYLRRFEEHRQGIRKACNSLGIDLYEATIDRPLELVLFDFLNSRSRNGQRVARRTQVGRRGTG